MKYSLELYSQKRTYYPSKVVEEINGHLAGQLFCEHEGHSVSSGIVEEELVIEVPTYVAASLCRFGHLDAWTNLTTARYG